MNSAESEFPISSRGVKKQNPGSATGGGQRQRSSTDSRQMHGLVGAPGPGDGVDPRLEPKRRRRATDDRLPGLAQSIHQQERFAAQVQIAIDDALQSATNPILNSLVVLEVVKQGGTLLVVAGPRNPAEVLDLKAAATALQQASSMLSREVASVITRKDTPNLSFVVLPAGAQKIDEGGNRTPDA